MTPSFHAPVRGIFFDRVPNALLLALLCSAAIHALLLAGLSYFCMDALFLSGVGRASGEHRLSVSLFHLAEELGDSKAGDLSSAAEAQEGLAIPPNRTEEPGVAVTPIGSAMSHEVAEAGDKGVLANPAEIYYSTDQLSLRPVALSEMESPDFDEPIQPGQASIIMDVFISKFGNVDRIQVLMSSLPERQTRRLLETFRRIRFQPGEVAGVPAGARVRVELTAENLGLPPQ